MARKERVTIAIDGQMLKRIDRLAAAKKQSRSAWFSETIADGLDQEEAAVKVFTDPLLRETLVKAFSAPGMLQQFAAAVGDELSQDQLKLFESRIAGVVAESKAAPVMKVKKKK